MNVHKLGKFETKLSNNKKYVSITIRRNKNWSSELEIKTVDLEDLIVVLKDANNEYINCLLSEDKQRICNHEK